jgi:hypothetical protein
VENIMTENTATITATDVVDAFSTATNAEATQQAIADTAKAKYADVLSGYDSLVRTTYTAVSSGVSYRDISAEAKERDVKGLSVGMIGYIALTGSILAKDGDLRGNIVVAPVSSNNSVGKIPAFDGEGKAVRNDAGKQVEVSARSLYTTVKAAVKKVKKPTVEAAIRNASDTMGAVEAVIALAEEPKVDDKTRADYLKAVRGSLGKAAETSRDKGDDFDTLLAEVEALVKAVRDNA